ncbi:MAG TPA: MFS transporter [archaeon]|nr:MFS transporter [archaeon]
MNFFLFGKGVESNAAKLQWIMSLRWFMLAMPVIVPFLQSNGLTLAQVFLLESFFALFIVALEVPTGYFADSFGRKNSILFGCVAGVAGLAGWAASSTFNGFLASELLLALSFSFISGADSALLYESLAQVKKEKGYLQAEGRIMAAHGISTATASVLGGFLALSSLRLPFQVHAVLLVLSIPLALSLVEPERKKAHAGVFASFSEMFKAVKFALHEHGQLKWLIAYSAVVSSATLTMAWFAQPYFLEVGLPLEWFGLVSAALLFSTSFFSHNAHRLESFLGKRTALTSLVFLVVLGFAVLAFVQALWGIAFLLLFHFARGFSKPVFNNYVNELLESGNRATVLSVQSLLERLLFAVLGPGLGFVADAHSLQGALLACAAVFLVMGVTALFFLNKSKALSSA